MHRLLSSALAEEVEHQLAAVVLEDAAHEGGLGVQGLRRVADEAAALVANFPVP